MYLLYLTCFNKRDHKYELDNHFCSPSSLCLLFSLFHYLWQGLDWDQLTALQAPAEAWPIGGWWAVTIEYSAENITCPSHTSCVGPGPRPI